MSAMRPLPRHAAHVSPEFGALMDRSCLVAQRLPTFPACEPGTPGGSRAIRTLSSMNGERFLALRALRSSSPAWRVEEQ